MNVPDRRSYCTCGHLATRHRGGSQRPCRERGCTCGHLQQMPLPRCGGCNHPVSFRRELRDGRARCMAQGCCCTEWVTSDTQPVAVLPAATVEVRRTGDNLSLTLPSPGSEPEVRLKISPTGHFEIFLSRR